MTTFDAIIPAGGAIDPEFALRVGTASKALIPFEGQTILRRTIDALQGTGRIGRVILVGTPEVLGHPDAAFASEKVTAGTSGPDTIFRGLKHLATLPNPPDQVLIVTADLPFLTAENLEAFLCQCPLNRGLCVPLITKTEYQTRFPESSSTFIPLRDESWTAGCVYVMEVEVFKRALPDLERLFQARKSKVKMIRLLGFDFLVKFVFKRLTIKDIEAKIKKLLNIPGHPVMGAAPELAYDVDDLEDYDYALKHLGGSHPHV
ncbi:MAG: NTP transferase domain-containing protein [Fimbriimonas sp.]